MITKCLKTIPQFAEEVQERPYWEQHDSAKHLNWSAARTVELPNLKPSKQAMSFKLQEKLRNKLVGWVCL